MLLAAALVVAVLVLAVLGSVTAVPWHSDRLAGEIEPQPAPETASVAPQDTPPPFEVPEPSSDDSSNLLQVLLTILAVVALAFLLRRLLPLLRRRPRPAPPDPEVPDREVVAAGTLEETAPDLPVLRRGVAEAQRELARHPDPHDAVIAAWLAVEEAAADSGAERQPAQTPTELATAVLAATEADPTAVRTLLRLYHRARFATGPAGEMTADDVATAGTCLRTLATGWAVRT